jgi:phosphoglycolate phosphatase
MRYALVIFDLDGTLADSFPWFLSVLNTVAREFRFREVAEDDIEPLRHGSVHDILRKLEVPLWKVPRIATRMRAMKRADMAHIPLFAGVDAMLRALSDAGVTLALVSSDNEANVRDLLGEANAALISHFACGASLFGKAAKFKRVIREAGVEAGATIAIGDEIRDIEAARTAGIACAAVTWGYAAPDALRAHKPDVVFEKMEEIAERFAP